MRSALTAGAASALVAVLAACSGSSPAEPAPESGTAAMPQDCNAPAPDATAPPPDLAAAREAYERLYQMPDGGTAPHEPVTVQLTRRGCPLTIEYAIE